MKKRRVEILSQGREYDGFFKIDKAVLRYERFDGTMSEPVTRLNFNRGDSVGVLLYDPAEEAVILVEQFRYPAYLGDGPGWLLEIVAGIQEEGQSLLSVAQSELLEETGYTVDSLTPILTFYPSPGGSSERIHLYLGLVGPGSHVGPGGGAEREGEDVRLAKIPLKEALTMIENGQICDGKTIIALQWLSRKTRNHGGQGNGMLMNAENTDNKS